MMNNQKNNISRWSRLHENHACCDDLEEENIADTFGPMSAFDRARWIKTKGKYNDERLKELRNE